jgi:hypothetical protein
LTGEAPEATNPGAATPTRDPANMVFSLDASQKWALWTLGALTLLYLGLVWLTLGVFTIGQPLRVNLFLFSFLEATPLAMLPWLKVGLVSLAGALLEVMWGVGYHGFWKKDYDPDDVFNGPQAIAVGPG